MNDSELKKHLNPSLYRILCLEQDASQELIKTTYRGLQKTHHPDKNLNNQNAANEKSSEINFAYSVLSNPTFRARYDVILNKYLLDEAVAKRRSEILKVQKDLKLVKEKYSSKMKSYLITYDLKVPGDYLELNETIKHFAAWWHGIDSTWIIKTGLNCSEIRDKLKPHIGKKDKLIVVALTGDGAWRCIDTGPSEWLSKYL